MVQSLVILTQKHVSSLTLLTRDLQQEQSQRLMNIILYAVAIYGP